MAIFSWALALLVSGLTVIGCVGPYQGIGPYDQDYGGTYYAPPPQNLYATPWVGSNSPWVFYQGDWFLNGMLYYFYGDRYGWAPYYAYPHTYIVRPNNWYGPKWNTWYRQHPQYWQTFNQRYPYWRGHRYGQRYDQNFYNRYHRGQGEGWQKGFHGRAIERPHPEGKRPAPAQVTPRERQRPGPARVAPPEERRRPAPAQVTPRERQRPGPTRVAPSEERRRPAPTQVTPREKQRRSPARMAPPEKQRPGPASTGGRKAPAGYPEKTAPDEEKH
jgi:hypothetical protein